MKKTMLIMLAAVLLLLAGCATVKASSGTDSSGSATGKAASKANSSGGAGKEAAAGSAAAGAAAQSYAQISQEEAKQMMEKDDGHVVVDVRRQDEYDAGHIPGAILIPNESIGMEQPEALPDLNQIILIYCRSGNRSKQAAQKLFDMGYTNIYEFGGIIDWTGETVTSGQEAQSAQEKEIPAEEVSKLLYMGHASIRITTAEGRVIYIDPYAGDGDGYGPAADLILVTHGHYDHTAVEKVENRGPDCRIITWKEALEDGEYQTFDLGYVRVEAVEAGYNSNHNKNECVGYVLTLSDGVSIYVSGDTSRTEQMPRLAEKEIDYAFYCCDGVYNMDLGEAAECADLVQAKHSIPYHIVPAGEAIFDRGRAEEFPAKNRLIIDEGEEIELAK